VASWKTSWFAQRARDLAEEADPFTSKRLLETVLASIAAARVVGPG
jgi:hypothetical protein